MSVESKPNLLPEPIISGARLKAFWSDPAIWGDQNAKNPTYVDDFCLRVNGVVLGDVEVEGLDDNDEIRIISGYLVRPPPGIGPDLEDAFLSWNRKHLIDLPDVPAGATLAAGLATSEPWPALRDRNDRVRSMILAELPKCCEDLLDWKSTGILSGDHMLRAANLLNPDDLAAGLEGAERMIVQLSLQTVVQLDATMRMSFHGMDVHPADADPDGPNSDAKPGSRRGPRPR